MKRVPPKFQAIAELLRRQQQQQQLKQQLQFEQKEQHQLQDLLQEQNDRQSEMPLALPNEFNNVKSIILDRVAPYYPFNSSNEILFNN